MLFLEKGLPSIIQVVVLCLGIKEEIMKLMSNGRYLTMCQKSIHQLEPSIPAILTKAT